MLMKKIFYTLLLVLCMANANYSHVGSPGVVMEGKAGPYAILVSVSPPDVIPGVAEVSIYVTGEGVTKVSAKPVYWYVGDEGSPKGEEMLALEDTPNMYQGIVWFMQTGTASLSVKVEGSLGSGETVVPIMASATAQNEMAPALGYSLAGLGVLLTVLMITIIGAAVSDGLVKPGDEVPARAKKKKYRGFAVATLVLALVLFGGKSWWDAEAASYERYMYKAPKANTWIDHKDSASFLTMQIDSTTLSEDRLPMGYLVPDHGKIMHMFIIKEGSLDVFAHLHPKRVDTLTFKVQLPPLPKGKYLVFGDIVRLNGFTETISDTLEIEGVTAFKEVEDYLSASEFTDPDNTFVIAKSEADDIPAPAPLLGDIVICGKPGVATPLPDGSTAVWEHEAGTPFIVGKVYPLTFAINDPEGNAAELQPYMGMMGHAVVYRKEGGVYVHLHPVGNYSMASKAIIEGRIAENTNSPSIPDQYQFMDSVDRLMKEVALMDEETRNEYLMKDMEHTGLGEHAEHGATVSFPYAFPEPGNYRIWIQMKRNGKVLNSSFDAEVVL